MILPFIVGLGSHHGDDQAGWLVVDQLQARGYPVTRLARLQHPADLLDVIETEPTLVICDACLGGDSLGTIRSLCWPTDKLAYQRPSGSHDLSLADVMELGQRLGSLPERVLIWTVQAGSWSAGSEPSLEVQSAAARVADAIWKDFSACMNDHW